MRHLLTPGLAAILALFSACDYSDDLCAVAADHVAACVGDESQVAVNLDSCDQETAESVLELSCEELETAKADGWLDSFLCLLGFRSTCPADPPGSEGESGSETPTLRALSGHVHKLGTGDPAPFVYVTLTALDGDEAGTSRGAWTIATGLFNFSQLLPGRYGLDVSLAANTLSLKHVEVDVASQQYILIYAPIP